MFVKAREQGLLRGIGYLKDEIHLTHLQFADDTLLFLEPNMDYLLNAKRVLRCFELVSGLRIKFHKSCLVKIGKKSLNDHVWAKTFRYVSSSLPILYLGLPLGGNSCKEALWLPVIRKVEDRLAPWKRFFFVQRKKVSPY